MHWKYFADQIDSILNAAYPEWNWILNSYVYEYEIFE